MSQDRGGFSEKRFDEVGDALFFERLDVLVEGEGIIEGQNASRPPQKFSGGVPLIIAKTGVTVTIVAFDRRFDTCF